MIRRPIANDDIAAYAMAHSSPPDEILDALKSETREVTGAASVMQIGADQGAFMTLMSRLLRPSLAIEIGTFTGYSSICIARGLADEGKLVCCDTNEMWTSIARKYWKLAGLESKVELWLGPALDTLTSLPVDQQIDLAFIDADKTEYQAYFELILERLAPQGVILVDNTLWEGEVLPSRRTNNPDTLALRSFNDSIVNDQRVLVSQLTIGDGLSLICRKL
ncbi:MAG: O-methyltransferase [Pseudomonadota bacterium]